MLFSFFSPKFDNFFWFLLDTSGKNHDPEDDRGTGTAGFRGNPDRRQGGKRCSGQ